MPQGLKTFDGHWGKVRALVFSHAHEPVTGPHFCRYIKCPKRGWDSGGRI